MVWKSSGSIARQWCRTGSIIPRPFEIETALAFWYFREKQCDIVVLETGMGGREDATNLITTTQVAVLASIGMDHMKFLGNSLEEIAAHKTGICKPGCQVVSMRQKEAAQKVVEQTAAELGCILTIADAANAKHVKYGLKKADLDYGNYKNAGDHPCGEIPGGKCCVGAGSGAGSGKIAVTRSKRLPFEKA